MKQIYIYILILMLLPVFSGAVLVDKPLNITIENCYNVSIKAELEEGSETNLQFKNCKKESTEEFYCECLNKDNNNFSIIMRTDNTMVRDIREYDLSIIVRYFDVFRKKLSVDVEDGGEYYEESQGEWREMTNKAKRLIKVEYVNTTVYEDRVVEVVKEKLVYVDKIVNQTIYVNNTEYFENMTRISELKEKVQGKNYLITIGFIALVLLSSFMYKNRIRKKNKGE